MTDREYAELKAMVAELEAIASKAKSQAAREAAQAALYAFMNKCGNWDWRKAA